MSCNRRYYFEPVKSFPLRHNTSVHFKNANFNIKADASAIIALGSFA